jgi:maltose alpha-D-glucosyltransferase/alpha-amylase
MPLTIRWTRYTSIDRGPASVLCAVRRGPREGTLLDATSEPEFIIALLAKIHAGDTIGNESQKLEFRPTEAFAANPLPQIETIKVVDREQSNSSVIVDDQYVVKILRRITAGNHPEVEVGRFLADVAHFQNVPTLLGSLELVEGESRTALAVVHKFIQNQGDAWTVTSAGLDRLVDELHLLATDAIPETVETASMLQRMLQVGRRTAEMHRAFASSDEIPAFAPEPITSEDVARWTDGGLARTALVFKLLERSGGAEMSERAAVSARRLMQNREAIEKYLEAGRHATFEARKIRHHGDFHLGQVLIAKDDAYILDFEGEPRRSLDERRAKAPAARDVAGFIRSIDYAAAAAVDREPDLKPEERATVEQRLRAWAERLSAAYWESYRNTLGDSPLWPADEAQTKALLDLFLLEKALYEIEYEFTNRPAWSHIPLEATLRILEQREVISPWQN